MALTKKQAAIFQFLKEYIADYGFAPTFEEISKEFGVAPATIHEHVKALLEKGLIRSERNRARSIEIVESDRDTESSDRDFDPEVGLQAHASALDLGHRKWPEIPLLGRIAAGLPIEAVNDRDLFDFNSIFPDTGEVFMLEVKGQSMIEDHIQDGDLVVAASRRTAYPGETVVALVRNEEATLKKFYPEGDKVRLEPANAAMKPIIVPAKDLQIQGVVLGVMRRY